MLYDIIFIMNVLLYYFKIYILYFFISIRFFILIFILFLMYFMTLLFYEHHIKHIPYSLDKFFYWNRPCPIFHISLNAPFCVF